MREKRTKRTFKIERGGKGGDNGRKPGVPEVESDAFDALGNALDTKPEGLAETHDFLRLLGAVVGQITLLDVATSSTDPKARASAARALVSLKERPEHIVERLRSSKFNSLDTKDLQSIMVEVRAGKDPRQALQECLDEKGA